MEIAGTYKLSTRNYPFISRLRNMLSGGISVFNCVIYFFRAEDSKELLWGTASPIQVRDKMLGMATKISSHGSYKIRIMQPSLFLTKLVGSNVQLQMQEDLDNYFSNKFQEKIRAALTIALNAYQGELLGIESKLEEFSQKLQPKIEDIVSDYGLSCVDFTIASLTINDDDLRRKYDEINMGNYATIMNGKAEKSVLEIQGEDWARIQAKNILSDVANNPNAGGVASAGAGIGMGVTAGNAFLNMSNQMFAHSGVQLTEIHTNQQSRSDRFTPKGSAANTNSMNFDQRSEDQHKILHEKLQYLKQLLEDGSISQSYYDETKKELLRKFRVLQG